MKRQKGCFNEECISFERKEKYPEEYKKLGMKENVLIVQVLHFK